MFVLLFAFDVTMPWLILFIKGDGPAAGAPKLKENGVDEVLGTFCGVDDTTPVPKVKGVADVEFAIKGDADGFED